MNMTIIGAGHVGLALAKLFARSQLKVSIASRRPPQAIAPLVQGLGASVTAVSLDEGLQADIVFLAIPWTAFHDFARAAAVGWRAKIVVDVMNAREDLQGRLSSNSSRATTTMRATPSKVSRSNSVSRRSVLERPTKAAGSCCSARR